MQISRPDYDVVTAAQRRRLLKSLPAVGRLLEASPFRGLQKRYGRRLVTDLLRRVLSGLRESVLAGEGNRRSIERSMRPAAIAAAVASLADELVGPRPRVVINATGVVVHTNLGRSPLSPDAARAVQAAAGSYVDLEYDLPRGGRGSRLALLEPLMAHLFPGYGFVAVNNNAAAILLCLRALSRGRDVVISRGELVEIGGSFRVPDILAASGARLREVGTTNRTRLADYEAALGPRTGLILKVHTSNFRIVGFTEETPIRSLAGLARQAGLPLVVDWGSGDLVDLAPLGIQDESPVLEVLAEGADLVTFSGDKLLGGPQAGLAVGREDLVARLRRDPLARVCRLDRLLVAALAQTLVAYVRGREFEEVPTLRMLALSAEQIGRRASRVKRAVGAVDRAAARRISLVDGVSKTGGGSSPAGERPTRLIAVESPGGDAAAVERRLRLGDPPVIGRIQEGRLLLDLRTVLPEQDGGLAQRLAEAIGADRDGDRG